MVWYGLLVTKTGIENEQYFLLSAADPNESVSMSSAIKIVFKGQTMNVYKFRYQNRF